MYELYVCSKAKNGIVEIHISRFITTKGKVKIWPRHSSGV
jgi:hypothetical protein